MRDLLALKGFLLMLVLFAAAMAATGTAVSLGMDQYLVPTPENSAEQFVRALKAHRFQAARDLLSEDLAEEVDEEQLREMVESLEEAHGGIWEAHGRGSQEQQDGAGATVTAKLRDMEEHDLQFALKNEQGIWKVDSIEPLEEMAGS